MFVFQVSAQKPFEQRQDAVRILTGKDAQRILQGLSKVCEPLLSKAQGKTDAF